MPRFLLPISALIFLIGLASAAAAATSPFDVSWSALDPGDDWAGQMIQSVFPVNGTPPTQTGTAATVIGQIVGQLTGFVMAIAMFYLCYITVINIHRVAETSQILTNSMSSLGLVRIGFAALMMFPLASGFSTGHAAVLQATKWGIGMARAVYANAIKAIGPDAMVIAIGSVSIDMTSQQKNILENILAAMRPTIESVAQNYWQTKNESALSALQNLYVAATQNYTQQLTDAATTITDQLRAQQNATDARNGSLGLIQNENQQSALG